MWVKRLRTFGLIIVILVFMGMAAGATAAPAASTLAGPCVPGTSYDPACDVDHDGDVDIFDIQLSAGHWNQNGTWMSDNDHNHLGQTWVGTNNPLKIQGTFGSPDYAPLILSNSAADGLVVNSASRDGIRVYLAGENGIYALSTSVEHYGGKFLSGAPGGAGVYARGGSNDAADVILGGLVGSGDDGRIYSEPSLDGSDILLFSNDRVHVHLDEDNNTAGSNFIIFDGANNSLWSVAETGMAVAAGPSAVQVDAGAEGKRLAYAVTSPQNWIEDFGSGQVQDGEAAVALEAGYAEAVSTAQPYHVFLTPLGDCALYVAEKGAASFTVRALGGETCSVAFDYRIVGLRRGYETVRMEQFVELTDE